jgi:predicted metal-dependent hydrolase
MSFFFRSEPSPQVIFDDTRVHIKTHPRARHLTLRQDTRTAQFILTKPRRTSHKTAIKFIEECRGWIESQKTKHPTPNRIESGSTIQLEGRELTIRHIDAPGIDVFTKNDELIVKCRAPRVPRAVQRFLIQRAENLIIPLAHAKAVGLKKPIKSIRFRDTSSRWGSCTHDGKLSFSWRLIMAPMEVIDYIVGHEVAHLEHMNHSKKFWDMCDRLTRYTVYGRHWLKVNGDRLYQIRV